MIKDILRYEGKKYQLSTINLNGLFETMIFPIENGIVSGKEVYCFRTCDANESHNKHRDIYYHQWNYISDEAIERYLKEKEEIYGTSSEPKVILDKVKLFYLLTDECNPAWQWLPNNEEIFKLAEYIANNYKE